MSTVIERSEVTGVYVIDSRGQVSLRYVRPGHRFGDQLEILSGLVAGERIALDPIGASARIAPAVSRAMTQPLGFSGRLARFFLENQLTPLLALTALLMGVFAVLVTPREEEPQIDVTFANIMIPFPGASSEQVENLVATPMEKVLGEISGVKHIYSVSRPGLAVLTVQYEVGIHRNDAIVRLYNAVYSNQDWRPAGVGILQPLIKPKGIDDVPIVTLTLWSRDQTFGGHELGQVARAIESEIKRVPGTRNVYSVGDSEPIIRVELDPARLTAGRAHDRRPCCGACRPRTSCVRPMAL